MPALEAVPVEVERVGLPYEDDVRFVDNFRSAPWRQGRAKFLESLV